MTDKEQKAAEKKRKKEEKKRLRAEKRRQKDIEWQKKLDRIDEEEEKKRREIDAMKGSRSKKKGATDNPSDDPSNGVTNKEPKKKWFSFGKKKKEAPVADDPAKISEKKDDPDIKDDPAKKEDPKKNTDPKKGKKSSKKSGGLFARRSEGEKRVPYEDDEETNPKIRLYNEIARHAYDLSEDPISREGLDAEEVFQIFKYVQQDYPELFWLDYYGIDSLQEISLKFRCKNANGELDVKQIKQKTSEMRKGAKYFTRGITRRTDPYEALLTIYRRVVLTFDYDGVGLNAHIDDDRSRDDSLRSLYNALVNHKVVCAGYAVAMQYLLQSVGIVCAYIGSEANEEGTRHAFNILKLGKYCYYLDATWGDYSNTLHDRDKKRIMYDYVCVPYDEFVKGKNGPILNHIPRASLYPTLEKFNYTNHEYFRYHNAYVQSYDENELSRIISDAAIRYNPKEMGDFDVQIRCSDSELMKYIIDMLNSNGRIHDVIKCAKEETAGRKKKALKWLELGCHSISRDENSAVMTLLFNNPKK